MAGPSESDMGRVRPEVVPLSHGGCPPGQMALPRAQTVALSLKLRYKLGVLVEVPKLSAITRDARRSDTHGAAVRSRQHDSTLGCHRERAAHSES